MDNKIIDLTGDDTSDNLNLHKTDGLSGIEMDRSDDRDRSSGDLEVSSPKIDASSLSPTTVASPPRPERIIVKLTVNLLKTFNLINQKYYAAKKKRATSSDVQRQKRKEKKPRHNNGHDDKDYNYIIKASEKLNDRYVVQSLIGKGSFGLVVRAEDLRDRQPVAVKIVKSKSAFFRQAQIEIKILRHLQKEPDKWNIVKLKDKFMHQNHQCLVFELLSLNLFELLKNTRFLGVSLNLIAKFGKQLLKTLSYLSHNKHGHGVIHCDLKPENILLRQSNKSGIKVIDFGSACFSDQQMYTYIQSRFYRAPEVLLGLPYSTAIDMWSLGCILIEMHTGRPLFDGENEADQVVKQVEILGIPPADMLERGKKSRTFFDFDESKREWRLKSHLVPNQSRSLRGCFGEKFNVSNPQYLHFENFLLRTLDYHAETRMKPQDGLIHAFILTASSTSSSSSPPALISSSVSLSPSSALHHMPPVPVESSSVLSSLQRCPGLPGIAGISGIPGLPGIATSGYSNNSTSSSPLNHSPRSASPHAGTKSSRHRSGSTASSSSIPDGLTLAAGNSMPSSQSSTPITHDNQSGYSSGSSSHSSPTMLVDGSRPGSHDPTRMPTDDFSDTFNSVPPYPAHHHFHGLTGAALSRHMLDTKSFPSSPHFASADAMLHHHPNDSQSIYMDDNLSPSLSPMSSPSKHRAFGSTSSDSQWSSASSTRSSGSQGHVPMAHSDSFSHADHNHLPLVGSVPGQTPTHLLNHRKVLNQAPASSSLTSARWPDLTDRQDARHVHRRKDSLEQTEDFIEEDDSAYASSYSDAEFLGGGWSESHPRKEPSLHMESDFLKKDPFKTADSFASSVNAEFVSPTPPKPNNPSHPMITRSRKAVEGSPGGALTASGSGSGGTLGAAQPAVQPVRHGMATRSSRSHRSHSSESPERPAGLEDAEVEVLPRRSQRVGGQTNKFEQMSLEDEPVGRRTRSKSITQSI